MIAVSACLAGDNCTTRGTNKLIPEIKRLVDEGKAFKACPEILGGLSVPRLYAEIKGGDGRDVLDGRAKVVDKEGKDITSNYLKGSRIFYEKAINKNIEFAVLRSNSPSCGSGRIYDGTFSGTLKEGDGVTSALLRQNGIKVITENEFKGD